MSYSIRFKQDVATLRGNKVDFRVYAVLERPPRQAVVFGEGMLVIKDTVTEGVYEAEIHHLEKSPTLSGSHHNPWVSGLYSEIPLSQRDVDALLVLDDGTLQIHSAPAPPEP